MIVFIIILILSMTLAFFLGKEAASRPVSNLKIEEEEPKPPSDDKYFQDARCQVCHHPIGCHGGKMFDGCIKCPPERRCKDYVGVIEE